MTQTQHCLQITIKIFCWYATRQRRMKRECFFLEIYKTCAAQSLLLSCGYRAVPLFFSLGHIIQLVVACLVNPPSPPPPPPPLSSNRYLDPTQVGKSSMSARHRFLTLKNLNWQCTILPHRHFVGSKNTRRWYLGHPQRNLQHPVKYSPESVAR